MMGHNYTLTALLDRFGFDSEELVRFIHCGLLLPQSWQSMNTSERIQTINSGFHLTVWSFMEVQRFEQIIHLLYKNYQPFLSRVDRRLETLSENLGDAMRSNIKLTRQVLAEVSDLQLTFEERDKWVDSAYFCEITGYRISTFHNSVSVIDKKIPSMHLDLEPYEKLIWIKRGKKKWECRLTDLKRIRSKFSYQLYLNERQRKGTVKEKIKININDLL